MAKTIYAVTSGSYSSYRVVALFSTREKAEDYKATVLKDEYDSGIEEYQLDPDTTDLLRRGYSVWRVTMLRDGSTERVDRSDNGSYDVQDAPSFRIWDRTVLAASVWAKSEKAAVKIANEKRAQMIANGEWK